MSIRVLLVDDHQIFLAGLAELMGKSAGLEIVAMATDGAEALALVERHRPDVVVMDITLPGVDGINVTRDVIRQVPETRVVCLSMHADAQLVESMFKAGASGYLSKDCDLSELVTGVRKVAAGESFMSASVVKVVAESFCNKSQRPAVEPDETLTDREREVLILLADGYTTKKIAGKLNLSAKTIATHREHIMQKLQISSIAGLTKYAIRQGLTSPE